MSRGRLLALGLALAFPPPLQANLLRNGSFQDDWITRLPENKNHHWCYASEYQNRRDYNPDGWTLSGSWSWENADAPAGQRRFVLRGPKAEAAQRVNWVLVHDDKQLAGFPDAGGFPAPAEQRSPRPLLLVRDFKVRAKLRGEAVPRGGASLELFLEPPAPIASGDPIGARVAPTVRASLALPSGSYAAQWVELSLPAARWLEAAGTQPPVLPGAVGVALRYEGGAGRLEVEEVELLEPGPASPNLLGNGSFEGAGDDGYPAGWSRPQKYRYFPPRHYYIANTWHNAGSENRGLVAGDALVAHAGARSLKMVIPAGDETFVASPEVVLNQREPRLIEISAWVLTHQLNMLQIDAVDERGERLPGFNFIHKAPVSIGSNGWRRIRQVLRPRRPVGSIRVQLAARGVNGYTLDDTGFQPQNSAVGTVFWDDVSVSEPESSAVELQARGVARVSDVVRPPARPRLSELHPGERLAGDNVLGGVVTNPGPGASFALLWEARHPGGELIRGRSERALIAEGGSATLRVPYRLPATPLEPYTEYRGMLRLVGADEREIARSELWFSPWSAPIDLELGALYLQPESTAQLVRVNLGFAAATLAGKALRIELLRRGSRQVLKSFESPADPAAIRAQRERIPVELREDFTNLLLADLDVSGLPVQPFADPQRNWLVRASVLDAGGAVLAQADSAPFCRQAHEPRQPPVESVRIEKGNLLFVNGRPFMPWGAIYGHVPVYAGPAAPLPGRQRDLANLPEWSIYDGFGADTYDRARFDFNCDRHVAGRTTPVKQLLARWASQNLYAGTAFVVPGTVFSVEQLEKTAGGRPALDAYLEFCKRAPMVVSVTPGIEEAFGLFQPRQRSELLGLRAVVELLRRATGKPVMVGHGGYWNRFEFEKVPFFDVFDPETEPFYPANLHTDLMPLIGGEAKAIWLRPQMYEDVPYERWRFHAFVELMRGARGWQIAHGPGDPSLFRGLHGELERIKPAAYSREAAPEVRTSPALESWARRHEGRTYVVAATTRGLRLGQWGTTNETGPFGRARVTESASQPRNEANAYGIGQEPPAGPALHGVQYLPDARAWPGGTRLVQWLRLDPQAAPSSLAMLVKAGGRWTHAAAWGDFDVAALRRERLGWFLRSLYRHAPGFLGWDDSLLASAAEYAPASAARQGALPERGRWQRLEVALDDIGATNTLVDGVAFLHEGGRVFWGRTSFLGPAGETVVLGDRETPAPEQLARTRIAVAGLKAGTPVRVLFEDRTLVAGDGHFVDDFRGRDLYQRYGGGSGYGDTPVALHVYEIPGG